MKVDIELDLGKLSKRLGDRIGIAQKALDLQIIKDANFYAPEDVGTLQDSAVVFTDIGSGLIEWNTVYARKQYYEVNNKSKDKNPNATDRWFEVAKANKLKDWVTVANAEYNK